jgi:hypothetical protein
MSFADVLRENRGNIEFSAGPGLAIAETVIERLVEKLFVLSSRGEIHVPQNNHPSFSDRGIRFTVAAQDATKGDDIARLEQQLIELENKATQLRMRLEELDEALKPENIDFALAGIGSTRPEELRKHRRRMLTVERNGVETQLKLNEESRIRTEAAIATAESSAYLKYLQPAPTPSTQMVISSNAEVNRSVLRAIFLTSSALIFVLAGLVSLVGWRRIK